MNLIYLIKEKLQENRLSRDIAYTIGSFAVLAVSGIVINIVITSLRDTSALGVFNQSYAVYIISSQLAVVGIHYSVLRYAAFFDKEPEQRGRLLASACFLSLSIGAIGSVCLFAVAPFLANAFDSEQTGQAISYASAGLVLFPLNKVLLAYLNGLRHMRAFSLLQSGRYLVVMVFVAIVATTTLPIESATLGFACAELITALSAGAYIYHRQLAICFRIDLDWIRNHLKFGCKALIAGMFAEFNSRIDVLLIGFFLPDREVGIYSFAAMLVDGLYHVLAMIRINFNPLLVSSIRDQDWEQAKGLLSKSKRYVLSITLGLAVLVVACYYGFSTWVIPQKGLIEGLPSLLILLTGLVFVSPLIPFDNLMLVVGHPGFQTVQQLVTVTTNIVVALLFLPLFGIEGGALGTAASYLAGVTMLIIFSYRIVGWNLTTNHVRG